MTSMTRPARRQRRWLRLRIRWTLAGLLIDTENYRTRATTDRVVLIDDDEIRLTEWMTTHLRLS